MREFWDARAREDPYFFVDNRLRYGDPDLDRFWEGGQEALEGMEESLEVRVGPEDTVVEIGCGVGRITRVLAERARQVSALDVSAEMLEVARSLNSHLENVTWILGDGKTLAEIPTASADVCQSDVVFQHIPDPQVTLGYVREMGRVLRPGGWAAFHISNDPALHRRRRGLRQAKLRLRAMIGRAPRGQDHPAWLGSATNLDRLSEVASESGMRVARVVNPGTPFCLLLLRREEQQADGRRL